MEIITSLDRKSIKSAIIINPFTNKTENHVM